MGFGDGFEIPPRGTSGGLAITWQIGGQCDVGICNENIANLVLSSDPLNRPWLLSFVYGPADWINKDYFLYDLAQDGNTFYGPCLCFGDFNAISDPSDKYGGWPMGSQTLEQ